jgi:hypothetical protein
MGPQIITTLAVFLFCASVQNYENRGWMGIIPLHSSNADVVEKLGFPNGGPLITYRFDKVNIDIVYSSSEPCHSGWNVPAGTVLRITLHIKQDSRPKLSELNLDLSQYEKRNDIELLDIAYYENKKKGITYVVWRDEVQSIYYGPSEDDNNLRCRK